MLRYLAAKKRLRELGYPREKAKWKAFWEGHRARCRGEAEKVCPYLQLAPAQLAAGRRTPQRRNAWLAGYEASAGIG